MTATDDYDTDEPLDQTELALEELEKGQGEEGGAGPGSVTPPEVETDDENGIIIWMPYVGSID